jgi:Na+-translocating ferredoxin:NAD+ oxidoreductase subunit B
MNDDLKKKAQAIEKNLPQTQCTLCDYAGCKPYSEALADNSAPIDRCLPGGVAVLKKLGKQCNQPTQHLEVDMQQRSKLPSVAWIDPQACIGCTKCIQACPVDAIVGNSKTMHAVIQPECTGCGLCIEPCPVDCIQLKDTPGQTPYLKERSHHFKARFEARTQRLNEKQDQKKQIHDKNKLMATHAAQTQQARLAFIKKARQKKQQHPSTEAVT